MTGLDQFLELFGEVTISEIVVVILAGVFLFLIYRQIKKYISTKINDQKKRDEEERQQLEKLDAAWSATQKCPEYRKQNIAVQQLLEGEIQEIKTNLQTMMSRFEEIEEQNKKRECSKLRDMLLQNYRYYTNVHQNPSQSWTKMESEAFWELFREYEEAGGNGYMHTVVRPEMERLTIVEVSKS